MRPFALVLAVSVFLVCALGATPSIVVASRSASLGASWRTDHGDERPAPADPGSRGDEESESESETEDADDSDVELVAVLPDEGVIELTQGRAQQWTRSHARPSDDPDPRDPARPPITA